MVKCNLQRDGRLQEKDSNVQLSGIIFNKDNDMAKRNGLTLRNIGIVVGILLTIGSAAGGIVWSFAKQSGNLDHIVVDVKKITEETVPKADSNAKDIEAIANDVAAIDAEIIDMDVQLSSIQKDVTITQTDVKYMREDIANLEKLTTKIWDKMNE